MPTDTGLKPEALTLETPVYKTRHPLGSKTNMASMF